MGGSSSSSIGITGALTVSFEDCKIESKELRFSAVQSTLDILPVFSVDITECEINGQDVTSPFGGAITIGSPGACIIDLSGTRLNNNSSARGGAISISPPDQLPDGLYGYYTPKTTIRNAIFSSNNAVYGSGSTQRSQM